MKKSGSIELVQVERLGQLERLLLEVVVDIVFFIADLDLACSGSVCACQHGHPYSYRTGTQRLSAGIALGLLVQQRLEVLQVRLQAVDEAGEDWQAVVDEEGQVVVEVLEGREAVLFSHGSVVRAS